MKKTFGPTEITRDHDNQKVIADMEHRLAMEAVGFAAQFLTPHAEYLGKFIDAEQRMHGFLHITDPTMYIKALTSDGLRQQLEISRAALSFVRAVQKVKDEIAEATP